MYWCTLTLVEVVLLQAVPQTYPHVALTVFRPHAWFRMGLLN